MDQMFAFDVDLSPRPRLGEPAEQRGHSVFGTSTMALKEVLHIVV